MAIPRYGPQQPVVLVDPTDGSYYKASGGAGGGDATAANQTLQITQETAINTALGTVTANPTANTVLDRLKALLTGTILAAGSAIIGKVGIDQTTPGTTNGVQVNAALPAGSNVIGHVIVDTTSTTAVTQATAANLNATVVLAAGSALAGKVGIDQTTPGTTNAVAAAGMAATDGTPSGNPLYVAAQANAAAPTRVEAKVAPLSVDLHGSQRTTLLDGSGSPVVYGSATGTTSQVASSASAVTILAANTARIGATIVNDSTAILYLILSTTTPTTSVYTTAMAAKGTVGAYYEVPFGYTGIIKGIWASANGNAVCTEMT